MPVLFLPGNNGHESRILLADCPCASLARYVTRALRAQKCCCRLWLMDLGWHCPRPTPRPETTINHLSPCAQQKRQLTRNPLQSVLILLVSFLVCGSETKLAPKSRWFVKEKIGGSILSSGFLPDKCRMRLRVIEAFVTIDIHPDPGDHPPFLLPPPPPQSPASATWHHVQKLPPRQKTHCF